MPQSIKFKTKNVGEITVSGAALEKIKDLAMNSRGTETGGILVGYNVGTNIQITDASDPGPRARRTATHFLRDTEHCRNFLARTYEETKADYVGEWHSHVISLRQLSEGDIMTLAGILLDADYNFASFAVFLVLLEDDKCQLIVYMAERARDKFSKYEVVIKVVELYRGEFPHSQDFAPESLG